jgi:hypothetical protein
MAFWNQASSEPKRQHRFLVNFSELKTSDGNTFQEYLAKTVKTPSFSINAVTHRFLGNEYHYPGTVSWEEVTVQIVNSVFPDGNEMLYSALQQSGYLTPDQVATEIDGGSVGTVNKANSQAQLGQVYIRELDGEGQEVGKWTLRNAWLTSVSFGDLDYAGDEILNIDIGIKYDWADYETGAAVLPL